MKIEPGNTALARLDALVKEGAAVGHTTIADEKQWNVFMRLDSPAVQ